MGRPKAQVYALLALDRILWEFTDAKHPLTVSKARELLHAIYRIDVSDEFVRNTLFGALKEFYALGGLPYAAAYRAKGSLLFPPADALYVQESRGRGSKNRIALVRREPLKEPEEEGGAVKGGACLAPGARGDEVKPVLLRCSEATLPSVIGRFGTLSGFSVQRAAAVVAPDGAAEAGDDWYDIQFLAPAHGLARWALGYPESVEIIEPLEAREQVKALLAQSVRRYWSS